MMSPKDSDTAYHVIAVQSTRTVDYATFRKSTRTSRPQNIMKYHIKNKISKKALREHRKKPLPLQLMIDGTWKQESEDDINATAKRIGANTSRDGKNIMFS